MRAAVVGAGMVGYYHVIGLKEAGVDVVAIIDPVATSREKITKEFGISRSVADYRELLDSDLDFVTIGTPHDSHCGITVDFLHAGKHVFCEKPIARTMEEADAMIAASRTTGKKLFIGLNHRFIPQNGLVKKVLEENGIGRPFMAISTFIGNEFDRMNDPANWKGTLARSGGGVVIDSGTHMIDLLRWWFGDVAAVTATLGTLAIEAKNKAEDSASLNLVFKSGTLSALTLTFGARFNAWPENYTGAAFRTDILGLEGSMTVGNLVPNFAQLNKSGQHARYSANEIASDTPANQFIHYVECMNEGKRPIVTAEDARETLRVVLAAYKSSKEGRRVLLSEILSSQ